MIHYDELEAVYEQLRTRDEMEEICYEYYKRTGKRVGVDNPDGIVCFESRPGKISFYPQKIELDIQNQENLMRLAKNGMFMNENYFLEETMFPDGVDILLSRNIRYCDVGIHEHDYFEIACMVEGEASRVINGQPIPLKVGDVIIVPPNVPHVSRIEGEGIVINVDIRKSTFYKEFRQFLEDGQPLAKYFLDYFQEKPIDEYLLFHCGTDEYWLELLLRSYQQCLERKCYFHQITNRLIQAGLYYIMQRYAPDDFFLPDEETRERMDGVYKKMCVEFQNVTLERAAKEFHVSVPYLSASMKKYFGRTFSELLRDIRLRHARELLKTGMKVTEVCQVVGYAQDSYFIRIFKGKYGMTPKQCQKLYSADEVEPKVPKPLE